MTATKRPIKDMILATLEPGACLTVAEIAAALDVTTHDVSSATVQLVSRGLVDRKAIGCFALTEEGVAWRATGRSLSASAPRPTARPTCKRPGKLTLGDRAWGALRIRQKATVADLTELARRDEATAEKRIGAYLLALERAGYVVRLVRLAKRGRAGVVRWLLVRDTGPLAPVVRVKRGDVWDRNTEQAFPPAPEAAQ